MGKQKRIKVRLSERSAVNNKVVKELDMLFTYSSSTELKNTLVDILLEYCLAMEEMPLHYKRNLECLYGLIHFLNVCENEVRQKKTNS